MEQLDLNKSAGLKAEDIQWGEPVVVDEIVQPTLEIPKELIPEIKEEEKAPEIELPKDVTFDDTEVET
jgi:hypothetical protein